MIFVQSMHPIISEFRFIARRQTDNLYRYPDAMKSITERTAFGHRLVAARKHAKMVQTAAAEKVGMSQGTLGELEREGQGSSYTSQLATLYGVNPVWLATGTGEMLDKQASLAPFAPRNSPSTHSTMRIESLTIDQLISALRNNVCNSSL